MANSLLSLEEEWSNFKTKFAKAYKDAEEEAMRKTIFSQTLAKVEAHNKEFESGNKSWSMGINQFADMTPEEIKKMHGGAPSKPDLAGST